MGRALFSRGQPYFFLLVWINIALKGINNFLGKLYGTALNIGYQRSGTICIIYLKLICHQSQFWSERCMVLSFCVAQKETSPKLRVAQCVGSAVMSVLVNVWFVLQRLFEHLKRMFMNSKCYVCCRKTLRAIITSSCDFHLTHCCSCVCCFHI